MRTETIERTFKFWDELTPEEQKKELQKASNDITLAEFFGEQAYQFYQDELQYMEDEPYSVLGITEENCFIRFDSDRLRYDRSGQRIINDPNECISMIDWDFDLEPEDVYDYEEYKALEKKAIVQRDELFSLIEKALYNYVTYYPTEEDYKEFLICNETEFLTKETVIDNVIF